MCLLRIVMLSKSFQLSYMIMPMYRPPLPNEEEQLSLQMLFPSPFRDDLLWHIPHHDMNMLQRPNTL